MHHHRHVGRAGAMRQWLFHAMSAFTKAGGSLLPDTLTAAARDRTVNLAVPAPRISGGLGIVAVGDLAAGRGWRRFPLHTGLVVVGPPALIPWSVVMFAARSGPDRPRWGHCRRCQSGSGQAGSWA